MITGYKILSSESEEELDLLVNNYINRNWVCQGGVTVCLDAEGIPCYWAQAMIKEKQV